VGHALDTGEPGSTLGHVRVREANCFKRSRPIEPLGRKRRRVRFACGEQKWLMGDDGIVGDANFDLNWVNVEQFAAATIDWKLIA